MMIRKIITFIVLLGLLTNCTQQSAESGSKDTFEVPDSISELVTIDDKVMYDIIDNIASPVEMAVLIKEVGIPFSIKYLRPSFSVDNFQTNYMKAIGIGFLGADLAYLNVYNQSTQIIEFMGVVKKLADELNVGQFFEKRPIADMNDKDSIMYFSVKSYNKMDAHLRESGRSDLSALIIAGVWLESLYHLTQVTKDHPSEELTQRIGEQKILINELFLLLKNFTKNKQLEILVSQFQKVKDEYDNVKINITLGEPESVIIDGVFTIIQNERSYAEISEEKLKAIIDKVAEVRNHVILKTNI